MIFAGLPQIGVLTLDVTNFLSAHPALVNDIAGHALAHALYSHMRRGRRPGMSRRQIRKNSNRQRRWFVDNIIMHHKRIHDRNRQLAVDNARSRAIARRDALKREALPLSIQKLTAPKPAQDESLKWRNAVSLRQKGEELRGRADARKLRARSRWLAISETKNN